MSDSVRSLATGLVRGVLAKVGIDVLRSARNPSRTLSGVSNQPIRTVLDVGANRGEFARVALGLFPEAQVFCFEPLPGLADSLRALAVAYPGRVELLMVALGNEDRDVEMHVHVAFSPSSSILATTDRCKALFPQTRDQESVVVPMRRLDAILSEAGRDRLEGQVLLKIDVQGFEGQVLRGATRTLQKVDHCMLEFSVEPLYQNQADFADTVGLLSLHGLLFRGCVQQVVGDRGQVLFLDAMFSRHPL